MESKPKPRQKVSPTVVSNFNEIIDASKTSESEKRGNLTSFYVNFKNKYKYDKLINKC